MYIDPTGHEPEKKQSNWFGKCLKNMTKMTLHAVDEESAIPTIDNAEILGKDIQNYVEEEIAWEVGGLVVGGVIDDVGEGLGKTLSRNSDKIDEIYDGLRIVNKKYANKTYKLGGKFWKKYPKGVKFNKKGFPDFSPYAKNTVEIKYTGSRSKDFKLANEAAGYTRTPKNYTWHHVEDAKTMQLVPKDLHGEVRHTGGFSVFDRIKGFFKE